MVLELMKKRHSVREYLDKPIEREKREVLNSLIKDLNEKYGTSVQIFYDDEEAFKNSTASYGSFCGCKNIIALVAEDGETAGYVGELIALKAQEIGLNTCFVALTYNKGAVKGKVAVKEGQKIQCSVAIGYGKTQGVASKSKAPERVLELKGEAPEYLNEVVEACLLAPTAMNQQKFKVVCDNGEITVKKSGLGFYTDVDLGIVKSHKDLILKKVEL